MAVTLLCVTPAAAIDRTLVVPHVKIGEPQRPTNVLAVAGGKGMNVARSVRALGGAVVCAALLGGHTGRLFVALAEHEGLRGTWTWRDAETRLCTSIVDEATGATTSFYEAGTPPSADEWQRFSADVRRAAAGCDGVCLSGSAPAEGLAALAGALCGDGRTVWLDSSDRALAAALGPAVYGVKINGDEAGALLGTAISDVPAAAAATALLRGHGPQVAAITLGALGAVVRTERGCWHAAPPPITVRSAVGSGDTFLAALALSAAQGRGPAEGLRLAVAASAANTVHTGVAQFTQDEVAALLARTTVRNVEWLI